MTLVLTEKNTSGPAIFLSADAGVSKALTAVNRKSMGNTVAERSYKHADYRCNFSI
jgi:hypothetical protein